MSDFDSGSNEKQQVQTAQPTENSHVAFSSVSTTSVPTISASVGVTEQVQSPAAPHPGEQLSTSTVFSLVAPESRDDASVSTTINGSSSVAALCQQESVNITNGDESVSVVMTTEAETDAVKLNDTHDLMTMIVDVDAATINTGVDSQASNVALENGVSTSSVPFGISGLDLLGASVPLAASSSVSVSVASTLPTSSVSNEVKAISEVATMVVPPTVSGAATSLNGKSGNGVVVGESPNGKEAMSSNPSSAAKTNSKPPGASAWHAPPVIQKAKPAQVLKLSGFTPMNATPASPYTTLPQFEMDDSQVVSVINFGIYLSQHERLKTKGTTPAEHHQAMTAIAKQRLSDLNHLLSLMPGSRALNVHMLPEWGNGPQRSMPMLGSAAIVHAKSQSIHDLIPVTGMNGPKNLLWYLPCSSSCNVPMSAFSVKMQRESLHSRTVCYRNRGQSALAIGGADVFTTQIDDLLTLKKLDKHIVAEFSGLNVHNVTGETHASVKLTALSKHGLAMLLNIRYINLTLRFASGVESTVTFTADQYNSIDGVLRKPRSSGEKETKHSYRDDGVLDLTRALGPSTFSSGSGKFQTTISAADLDATISDDDLSINKVPADIVQVPQHLCGGSDHQKSFIETSGSDDDDRSGSVSQSGDEAVLGGCVGLKVHAPKMLTIHHDDSEDEVDADGRKPKDKVNMTTPTIAPGSNASHERGVPVVSAGGETATLAPDRAGNEVAGTAAVAAGSSTNHSKSSGAKIGAAGEPTKPTSGLRGPSASDAEEAPLSKREREHQWVTVAGADRSRKPTPKGAEYRETVGKKGGTAASGAPKGSTGDGNATAAGASPTSPSGKRYKVARSPTGATPATAESAAAGSVSSSASAPTSTPPAKPAFLKSGSGGGGGGRRDGGDGGKKLKRAISFSFPGTTNTVRATDEANASTASTSAATTVVPKSTDKDKTSEATASTALGLGSVGSGASAAPKSQ
jgi:hypothetical protein